VSGAEPAGDAARVATPGATVRRATGEDVTAAAAGVAELLVELGGEGPSAVELERAVRELAADRERGALLVAEVEGEGIVGVLAASWQFAVHVPGRYGTIQDLWVHPDWRSKAIGRDLLAAFFELAKGEGAKRVEVGLPRDDFPSLRATEGFYLGNGFANLGPRMRRRL
jgi:branched-chain amino acid aminotransferase